MASSSSQSVQACVSDDRRQNEIQTRRMEEVPNGCIHGAGVVCRPNMARRHWTRWEDFKLIKHIVVHGGGNWKIISDQLPGRTPESCKVRWLGTLNPLLKKPPLRREEERISVEQLGRTDVYVKIFYHALMDKKLQTRMKPTTTSSATSDNSVVSLGRSSVQHWDDSSLSGKTAFDSGIDLNGPSSDEHEDGTLMGNSCNCYKRAMRMGGLMANEETFMATNKVLQPQSPPPPPSTPKLIDFMGIGSV